MRFHLTASKYILFIFNILFLSHFIFIAAPVAASSSYDTLTFRASGHAYPNIPKLMVRAAGVPLQTITIKAGGWHHYSVDLAGRVGEDVTLDVTDPTFIGLKSIKIDGKAQQAKLVSFNGCADNKAFGGSLIVLKCVGSVTFNAPNANTKPIDDTKDETESIKNTLFEEDDEPTVTRLVLKTAADLYEGAPDIRVKVNNTQVARTKVGVAYDSGKQKFLKVSLPPSLEIATVDVQYGNDVTTDAGDRNLYITDLLLDNNRVDLSTAVSSPQACLELLDNNGAQDLKVLCNTSVRFTAPEPEEITTPETQTLRIQATADPLVDGAAMEVAVNGMVLETVLVTADRTQGQTFDKTYHLAIDTVVSDVRVAFLNNATAAEGKRDLYLTGLWLNNTKLNFNDFNASNGCSKFLPFNNGGRIGLFCNGAVTATFSDGVQQVATAYLRGVTPPEPTDPVDEEPVVEDPTDPPAEPPVATLASCACNDNAEPDISKAAIASYRFGFGPKNNGDLASIATNPQCWLKQQVCLTSARVLPASLAALPDTMNIMFTSARTNLEDREAIEVSTTRPAIENKTISTGQLIKYETRERFLAGVETNTPFVERWVQFWSNHFTVAAANNQLKTLVGAYEREVIRANMFGSMSDLALASAKHPGMLIYLDNNVNSGNNSVGGQLGTNQFSLNENYGRELLELHCIGVDTGPNLSQVYSEADVIEASKIVTGWRVPEYRENHGATAPTAETESFYFYPYAHEPGDKTVLGRTYGEGLAEGERFVKEICNNQYTAKLVARKLARHFISDTPPASAIEKLETAFLQSGGNLQTLALTLIEMEEAWDSTAQKFNDANYFLTSMLRQIVEDSLDVKNIYERLDWYLVKLNQSPWRMDFPEGWCDRQECWLSGQALADRLNISYNALYATGYQATLVEMLNTGTGGGFTTSALNAINNSDPASCATLDTGLILKPCTARAVVAAARPVDSYNLFFNSLERYYR